VVSKKFLLKSNLKNIVEKYPFIEEFLKDNQIEIELNKNIEEILNSYDEVVLEEKSLDREKFIENLVEFVNQMVEILGIEDNSIEEMTILAGINKFLFIKGR